MIYEVDAHTGAQALRIRPGLIARRLPQPGKYLVFESVADAIGHPTAQIMEPSP